MIYLIALLLLIQVIVQVWEHLPVSEKRWFKRKLIVTRKMVLDFKFKKFETQVVREGIRKDYDQVKAKLDALKEKKDSKYDDEKIRLTADVERYEKQLTALDMEVNGADPSVENPDGYNGITQHIEKTHQIERILKEYIKEL